MLFVLLGILVVLAGCSAPEAGAPSTSAGVADPEPDQLAFGDDGLDPERLRLALVRPDTWDPARLELADQSAVVLADLLYDGLTEASADGELRPGLADNWEANDDFTVWTFDLDTERIAPDEVVASFERLRELGTGSYAAQLLDDVEAIDPVGEDSVSFRLASPQAGLPWLLSGVTYSVVGAGADESDPLPTGRYRVASLSDDGMELVSGDASAVDVTWGSDGRATSDSLAIGLVDAAVVDPDRARDAAQAFGQKVSSRGIVRFYGLNLASPDLWDPRVREAVLAGADRAPMVAAIPSAGIPADGVAARSTAGFAPGLCDRACVYNPARAEALLAEVSEVPDLTVAYIGDSQAEVAEVLAGSLRDVGFDVSTEGIDVGTLAQKLEEGSIDVFSFGWVAPAGSIDAVVGPLFGSSSFFNVTRLVSPEVDDLLAQAAITADDRSRWDLLNRAEQVALSQWIAIPVAVARNSLVQSDDIASLPIRPDGSIDVAGL